MDRDSRENGYFRFSIANFNPATVFSKETERKAKQPAYPIYPTNTQRDTRC